MNKAMIGGIAAVAVVGAVVGAGLMGVVNVPGLTPEKADASKKLYEEEAEPPPEKQIETPKEPVVEEPPMKETEPESEPTVEVVPEEGAKKLARLWNEMDVAHLAAIVEGWSDADLAPVLILMEPSNVAELLGALKPEKASSLSRVIRAGASRQKVEPTPE